MSNSFCIGVILAATTCLPASAQSLAEATTSACVEYRGIIAEVQNQGLVTDRLLPEMKRLCELNLSQNWQTNRENTAVARSTAGVTIGLGNGSTASGSSCCTKCACWWHNGQWFSVEMDADESNPGRAALKWRQSDTAFENWKFGEPETGLMKEFTD